MQTSNMMQDFLDSYDDLVDGNAAIQADDVARATKTTEERHGPEFPIIVECGRFIFRTSTNDLSPSGLTVKHTLPAEKLDSNVAIYISKNDKKENLLVSASYVADRKFQFDQVDEKTTEKIKTWLT